MAGDYQDRICLPYPFPALKKILASRKISRQISVFEVSGDRTYRIPSHHHGALLCVHQHGDGAVRKAGMISPRFPSNNREEANDAPQSLPLPATSLLWITPVACGKYTLASVWSGWMWVLITKSTEPGPIPSCSNPRINGVPCIKIPGSIRTVFGPRSSTVLGQVIIPCTG